MIMLLKVVDDMRRCISLTSVEKNNDILRNVLVSTEYTIWAKNTVAVVSGAGSMRNSICVLVWPNICSLEATL